MPLCQSYVPNYFSIQDILATQERVPCKFEMQVKQLGKVMSMFTFQFQSCMTEIQSIDRIHSFFC